MSQLGFQLLALLVYGPAIILLHELGHAAMARPAGYRVTEFAIGLGRPVVQIALRGGAVLHVDRFFLAGGACVAIPLGPPSPRRALFHAGGLIAQVGLALLLLPLSGQPFFRHMAIFNLLVLAHNAVPWRLGAHASDGWRLLDLLRGGPHSSNVLAQHASFTRMLQRSRQSGSPLGTAYARVCLAWAEVLAGRPEQARSLFQDDPPAVTVEPWVDALYHYVQAEWHRAEGRPLAALHTATQAASSVTLEHLGEAEALIALAEARALVDLGSNEQALRVLGRTAGVSGSIGWQASVTLLWASIDGGTDDLELATWRVLRRLDEPGLDLADAARALWAASEALAQGGRLDASRGALSAATRLARRGRRLAPQTHRQSLDRRIGKAAGVADPGVASGR